MSLFLMHELTRPCHRLRAAARWLRLVYVRSVQLHAHRDTAEQRHLGQPVHAHR